MAVSNWYLYIGMFLVATGFGVAVGAVFIVYWAVKHLSDKGLLLRHYTQNIDGLERKAGVPEDELIEAHGSFSRAHCISSSCRKEYSQSWMMEMVGNDTIPTCSECNNLVKPDIVFFGESLPQRFHDCVSTDFGRCDLVIVMGTSLKVQPFASLVEINRNCPMLLINLENAAPWLFTDKGSEVSDDLKGYRAFWKGACDDGCIKLKSLLWWQPNEEVTLKTDSKLSDTAATTSAKDV